MKKLFVFIGLVILTSSMAGCTGMVASQNNPHNAPVAGNEPADVPAEKIVTFDVIGKGIEPDNATSKGQAVLMAERAAVADGYRQFVEKIRGVYVEAYLKSGYGTVNWDRIKTSTQSWLRGVEVIEIKQGSYGIIEAHMQLRVNFVKDDVIWWPVGIDAGTQASL